MDTDRNSDHHNDTDRARLGARGKKNRAKGRRDQAAGKVEESFGKLTGQKDVEMKGRARQVKGTAQHLGGRVEEGVDAVLGNTRGDRDNQGDGRE